MLGVPAPSFPTPASQQRASSSGRNKVPLKPGRSLMDWIRLTKSGKDLTGLRGRLLEVTEKELAKHNRKEDCWMCIRGLVYNVTPYMEYHPGGEEELMKAAGADGTDLFDQVHRWVNYESMLKECLVGKMANKLIPSIKEIHSSVKKNEKLINGVFSTPNTCDKSARAVSPRYDWFQTEADVTVVIYVKQKDITSESVIVDLEDGVLRIEVILNEYTYLLHIELSHEVDNDSSVHIAGAVGKIEVKLKKMNSNTWRDLGNPLGCHNTLMKKTERELFFRKCKLVSVAEITYNTKVFCLQLPQGTHLQVPVGHHVYLKHSIKGTEIIRPYTPITHYLEPCVEETSQNSSGSVYLMIKIYPSGVLTPQIDSLQIGEFVCMSNPDGTFQTSQLLGVTDLFLLAAGTGFTPMVKVINFSLRTVPCLRKCKLLFFNKTEDDILWREKVEELELMDKRFSTEFILSEPSDGWNGKFGRISLQLLSEILTRPPGEFKPFICICGPRPFTEEGVRCVQELGYLKEEMHAFTG